MIRFLSAQSMNIVISVAHLCCKQVHAIARKVLGDLQELRLCLCRSVACLGFVQLHQLRLIVFQLVGECVREGDCASVGR